MGAKAVGPREKSSKASAMWLLNPMRRGTGCADGPSVAYVLSSGGIRVWLGGSLVGAIGASGASWGRPRSRSNAWMSPSDRIGGNGTSLRAVYMCVDASKGFAVSPNSTADWPCANDLSHDALAAWAGGGPSSVGEGTSGLHCVLVSSVTVCARTWVTQSRSGSSSSCLLGVSRLWLPPREDCSSSPVRSMHSVSGTAAPSERRSVACCSHWPLVVC